jgi:2-polyprenyl-6-methoxyphenol hydroxylase-like FAD-dependent oxidoreductase
VFFLALTVMGLPDEAIDSETRLKLLKEKAQGLVEPWKSAFLWIPEGTKVSTDKISYWKTTSWDNDNGRTTLVGDAAHPLPSHRGQGLNNCIVDVAKLAEQLSAVKEGKMALIEAIDEYEKEMIPRGAQEVMASRGNTLALLNWDQMMESPLMKKGLQAGN